MAVNRKKTAEATTEKKQEQAVNHQCVVKRAKDLGEGKPIMCDVQINQVMIYGCAYKTFERKDGSGEFSILDFPKRKGSDGKYYNEVYVKLSEDDIETIEKQIEGLL